MEQQLTDQQAEEYLLDQLTAVLVRILGRRDAERFIVACIVKAEAEAEIAHIRGWPTSEDWVH